MKITLEDKKEIRKQVAEFMKARSEEEIKKAAETLKTQINDFVDKKFPEWNDQEMEEHPLCWCCLGRAKMGVDGGNIFNCCGDNNCYNFVEELMERDPVIEE